MTSTTACTAASPNRPISKPNSVTASVAAAWGVERPKIVHVSAMVYPNIHLMSNAEMASPTHTRATNVIV